MNLIKRIGDEVDENVDDVTKKASEGASKANNGAPNRARERNNDPTEAHADLFTGLGRLRNHEYSIAISQDVEPVKCPPRTIPHKIRDKVKEELARMEELGVIERVDKPTEWVNQMTVVHKPDGRVRICLDPRGLNTAIRREHFPMPTFEQVAARMAGAQVFSKFDATSGYWQLPLTEKSSYYTTFNSPFGRYRYKVMPFGISSASEIWQRAMTDEFGQLKGVEIVADDILVWGKDEKEHDARLEALLEKVKASGLKLNKAKSVIRKDRIEYVGHVISKDGVKPSDDRIKSILDLPYPTNKKEVETLLGMMTYLGKFIPNLSEITAPLRQLTQKNIAWHWEPEHADAVDALKKKITSAPTLKLYDAQKPVSMATDASNEGLGAVLMHDESYPIAYASRRVNDAERNYAAIEKEMSAILFACRKFHDYIFGQKVTIFTDHKPLIGIFSKPLHKLSPRLQRMRLHLMSYDIDLRWKPGKEMFVPDALSRLLPVSNSDFKSEQTHDIAIETVDCIMQMSAPRLEQFKVQTKRDPILQKISTFIRNGWPESKRDIPNNIRPYYSFRDELTEIDGLIMKGNRLVVPSCLQKDMLDVLHQSHLGIVKIKARARQVLFWPGMSAQIEDKVARCITCQTTRKAQQSEPLIPHPMPNRPWSKLGMDIFHLDGVNYLLVVDYYSKYPEIQMLTEMTSHKVISSLNEIFSRNGIPDTVISDNARQFVCSEFREFTKKWEIKHITSSPTYPQSNGQAERCVQTIKMLMKRAKMSGNDPMYALLEYRNTPMDGLRGFAPSQILNGRLLRSCIPVQSSLLCPQAIPPLQTELKERQRKHMANFNSRARPSSLSPLRTNQKVIFRAKPGTWQSGYITSTAQTPRSYNVKTEQREYRRNRKHIRPMPPSPSTSSAQSCSAPLSRQQRDQQNDQRSQRHETITLSKPTTTRSGRVSKPPERLQL
ncbi:uncharacterized protein K02A2.6-like [Lytechinus variegatus]|uniref:uncharacterized protein K02A2.6-like n=1 Tax=Lytechinus variegatus TaxID=7654 RepID=UPI001BB2B341|nr:uncharacterized protein K02A2.6-like [Lytechinus variegatus]